MLYNLLRGTVQIEIRSGWPERFLSSCAQRGIALWNTSRKSPDCFTAWVSAADYFRLRKCAGRSMTRLHILQKRGIPFVAHRLMRKRVLWLTALACLLGIWYLSGFVWTISVTGCSNVSQREVLELLEQHGLHFGTRVKRIDGDLLRNDVLAETDKLAYLVVNVHGTHAEIKVTERSPVPDAEALAAPCDVVADGTGVIQALRVLQGTALVKVGDAIAEGERIASGIVTDAQGGVTRIHAVAEADILTRRILRTAVPAEGAGYTRSGGTQTRRYFVVGSCKIPLNIIEKKRFAWYDKTLETKQLVLREDFRLDLGITVETEYVCSTAPVQADPEALARVLKRRMEEAYAAACPSGMVQSSTFRMEEENGAYVGILELETIETIGVTAPLEEDVANGTDR